MLGGGDHGDVDIAGGHRREEVSFESCLIDEQALVLATPNARTMTAHVYFADGLVYVEQSMHAYGVDEDTLGQAFIAVSGLANNIGSLMAMTFGGDTPYPADTEDADAHDEAA